MHILANYSYEMPITMPTRHTLDHHISHLLNVSQQTQSCRDIF